MYEIVQIQQEVWMIPKFKHPGELSDWERLWLNCQRDMTVNGYKIKIQPQDVEAIEDKIGEKVTIRELFERWRDEYGVLTAPSEEHMECPECEIEISGDNKSADLCRDHVLNL